VIEPLDSKNLDLMTMGEVADTGWNMDCIVDKINELVEAVNQIAGAAVKGGEGGVLS